MTDHAGKDEPLVALVRGALWAPRMADEEAELDEMAVAVVDALGLVQVGWLSRSGQMPEGVLIIRTHEDEFVKDERLGYEPVYRVAHPGSSIPLSHPAAKMEGPGDA